jgi:hypothetical protein
LSLIVDYLVVSFALLYYFELSAVYFLRARELTTLEWKMGPALSALLIPFSSLWVLNVISGSD